MALINCPECGKKVSERAVACPSCGYPIATDKDLKQKVLNTKVYLNNLSDLKELYGLSDYLKIAEKNYLKQLNDSTKGNKTEMARILKISRKNLWEKMKKYGLE